MGLPWRWMSLASIVASYLVTSRTSSRTGLLFFANFAAIWMVQFLAWVVWAVVLYPKVFSPIRGLPEPSGNSFFNGQFARISAEPSGVPMIEWINSIPNNGIIRYLGLLNQERILITSPKTLTEVLVTKNYDFQKPAQFRYGIGRILGIGLLLAEGDEHKMQRRNLAPAFAFRHVKDLYQVFWNKSRQGVQAMTEEVLRNAGKDIAQPDSPWALEDAEKATEAPPALAADQAVIEVGQWASRITLDIIGVAGLGRDFGAIADPDNELIQTYSSLFKPSRQARLLALAALFIPGWIVNLLPVKRNEDVHQAARTIRAVCRDLIARKKAARLDKEQPSTDVDILSVALESGGFTDENLVDQLMTFLAAGHETTASAMTWAIYLLCVHPDVQTRLRAEIRSRLPSLDDDSGAAISSIDIDRMPYLTAVCNEVLRYFGPVPLTVREAARDTSVAGQHVPKGTRVMLVPWAVNKSRELWGPDALLFNPNRWLDGNAAATGGATSNYAFLTFLHGPRSCVGSGFAKAEFACLLAAWVGRFEFELRNREELDEKKISIKAAVTARPSRGMYVKTRVVEGW